MPPATMTLADPALIRSWPSMIAFMPEPQTLLTVVQPASFGRPAPSAAWRAGAWPRPAGSTQPMITSSTASGLRPACATAAWIATVPSCVAGTPVNWPSRAPMGVRLAPAMTTLDMGTPDAWGRPQLCPTPDPRRAAWKRDGMSRCGSRLRCVRSRPRNGRRPAATCRAPQQNRTTAMTHTDALGLPLTGASADAARLFDQTQHLLQCYIGDPVAPLSQALEEIGRAHV